MCLTPAFRVGLVGKEYQQLFRRAPGKECLYSPESGIPADQAIHERRGQAREGCRRLLVGDLNPRSGLLCSQLDKAAPENQPSQMRRKREACPWPRLPEPTFP